MSYIPESFYPGLQHDDKIGLEKFMFSNNNIKAMHRLGKNDVLIIAFYLLDNETKQKYIDFNIPNFSEHGIVKF